MARQQNKMDELMNDVREVSAQLLNKDTFVKKEYRTYENARKLISTAAVVAGLGALGVAVNALGGDMGAVNTALEVGGYVALAGGAVATSVGIGEAVASWNSLKNYPKVKEVQNAVDEVSKEVPGAPKFSDDFVVSDIVQTGRANDFADYLDMKRSKLDKEGVRLEQRKADLENRKEDLEQTIRNNDAYRGAVKGSTKDAPSMDDRDM